MVCGFASQAQYNYNSGVGAYGDLLIGFRPSSGSYDLVVDAGSVTSFINLGAGQSIAINPTYYTGSFLSYIGTNSIFWSAFACQRLSAQQTNNVWVTRARTSLNTQSTPWPRLNYSGQGGAASQIDSIGDGSANIAFSVTTPFGTSPAGSSTAIVEPKGGAPAGFYNSYSYLTGSGGNLGGNFWGDAGGTSIEQATASNFTTSGQPVRADFYQLNSTTNASQVGTYLGYFELATNGVLTYYAATTTLATPAIVKFTRIGTTNTIYYTTGSSGTYTLRATNSVGLASASRTNWPSVFTLANTTITNSITEVTTNAPRFYVITGQ